MIGNARTPIMKRYRAGEKDVPIHEGIHLSINAIAIALRNWVTS